MGHVPEHYAHASRRNHFKFASYGPTLPQVRYVVAQLTTSSQPNISLFISSSQ